ncbi:MULTISPECIES: MlaD family protein [unclassified Bartonella]|uniref:MlaD family protein n=1 Tax=unclassified Bartonella TaxID=2645622 RepID=UPI0015FA1932|nr:MULTISPECIES: MlaD family protein [unclassified Bartonella]UXN04595.1 MCE family protein [Bartonella sp. HY406]UXN07637.1 MCE family protein [Bartonella sp. HY761]
METKASYVLVGSFTLGTLAAAFAIILYFGHFLDNRNLAPLDIRIPGSVTGLSASSQVLFNGIKVGTVRQLVFDDTNPNVVIAKTEVNRTIRITRSTQATLGFQGLTGLAFIELKGGSLNESNLVEEAQKEGAVARIDADPSTLNNLLATAQDIFARANEALTQLEGFIKDARGPLTQTAKNAELFSNTLVDNRDDIDKIMTDTREMMARLSNASQKTDAIMAKLDNMLSPDNKNSVVVQAQETLASIKQTSDTLNAHIKPIANNVERFSGQGLRNIEALVNDSRISVQRIERALTDLEKNPQQILFGSGSSVPQYDGRNRR